jgi:hypothetical protein
VPRLLADAISTPGPQGALLFSLASISVVMIPAALGRADPPHVLFYGLGVSLLFFVQTANRSRGVFALYAAVYAILVIGGLHVSNARAFYGASLQSLRPGNILAFLRSSEPEITDSQLGLLDKYPPLGLPHCSYDRRTVAYLWSRRQVEPEYYCGIVGVYSEEQLSRKLAETTRHEYVLARKSSLVPLRDVCRRDLDVIRKSFIYPASLRCEQEGLETTQSVTHAIREQYRVVEEVGQYVVMRRVAGR